ncbi:MAG: GspE/PulE family protein [Puniceicoccales bacterium]|jgi:type II secretory ATPase GspE/PulE/Tfp pilus assembly ATPase PilB-like protein|nr:GspE/PulE family protein [Puniceicoccales bacterium]
MNGDEQAIIKFVDDALCNAVHLDASDIHFEIFESDFAIRYRVDGMLRDHAAVNKDIGGPVMRRLKVLANLNIAEYRLPQDGNFVQRIDGSSVEFRISTLPTQFGESVVLRVLQSNKNIIDIHQLCKSDSVFEKNLEKIMHGRGITLLTGPTGCGKTTTLYSISNELNRDDIKILTCEDPIEYIVDGISQSSINADIGFSFDSVLRSFLRHDPDIILVGEIRDRETAELAVRAALTGHTIFSTLHANDAVNAIPRLLDLGVDKNMLAEAVVCIIAQRLVPNDAISQENSRGRRAVFETLMISEELKHAIKSSMPTKSILALAMGQGMVPLSKFFQNSH